MNMRTAMLAMTVVVSSIVVSFAQTETATVSGRILDNSGAAVAGAEIVLTNVDTNAQSQAKSGKEGLYVFAGVTPGRYRLAAGAAGFSVTVKNDLVVRIQDELAENFTLQVGSVNEVVTVSASPVNVNTADGSVSTVIDQTYVKNMPLNGRSFQDLILLTPGIVTQTSQTVGLNNSAGLGQTGEFSVNGQRPESNNYMVDGVSANVGATTGTAMIAGAGASGSVPGETALGTTQALVSVDDLQEFRVQSSSYSAEYGRNPGGQFAFETKSGTNMWHGTLSEYLRNGAVDANDWFNDYLSVQEPALRQNDFGGTLGGPLRIPHLYNGKDRTFFFVSYEGLRLIQPQAASVNGVPDDCLRGTNTTNCAAMGLTPADPAVQPVLRAFPIANGPEFGDGFAPFKGSWSNPSSIDSTSVRLDQVVSNKIKLFFRFSDTGSDSSKRGTFLVGTTPSVKDTSSFTMRSYTAGVGTVFSSRLSNEFRINYSSNESKLTSAIDAFDSSTPINLAQLTGLGAASSPNVLLCWDPTYCPDLTQGPSSGAQRQWNFVDTLYYSVGRHQLKFGADYRRLAPFAADLNPLVLYGYFAETSLGSPAQANSLDYAQSFAQAPAYPLYKNFSAFVEDEWKVSERLNLSLGLRWDVNPPPGVTRGLMPYTVQGASPADWTLAPQGTPLWHTAWFNFAPRLGVAYTLHNVHARETVVRAGGGIFFDTGQQLGSAGFSGPGLIGQGAVASGIPFPLLPPAAAVSTDPGSSTPTAFPPHFQLPYSLQWNASVEQALGRSQALTFSYVGAHGGRLLQQDLFTVPSNPWGAFFYVNSGKSSDYHSAQVQYRRRLSLGLTALGSYTWSHCIDYGSQNYYFGYQRGSCDYDVRHNVSTAFSYDLPTVGSGNSLLRALVNHWGIDDRFTARSGFPVTLNGQTYIDPLTGKTLHGGLNWNPSQPLYLYGANCMQTFQNGCPGGRAVNPNAFAPAVDANGNQVVGDAPRNLVRGFGAWQMDVSVRREFPIYDRMKLQFRAEAFNVFNHPNFGAIFPNYCMPATAPNPSNGCQFGQPFATLANSLGILSPLYQMGGARSMQFALKIVF